MTFFIFHLFGNETASTLTLHLLIRLEECYNTKVALSLGAVCSFNFYKRVPRAMTSRSDIY